MSSNSWKSSIQKAARAVIITVKNYTHFPLTRSSFTLSSGAWKLFPQEIIPPYAEVQFAASNKGVLSGVDGSVTYSILFAKHQGEKVTFNFKSPYVDPRWCSTVIEPESIRPKFRLETSDVSDPIYEIHWSIYTTLSKEDAPPGNIQEYESESDSTWTKDLMRGAKSVYYSITNSTSSIFYRKKYDIAHGMWCHLPPDMLFPGRTTAFGARASSMVSGTEGQVLYVSEDFAEQMELTFSNPFLGSFSLKTNPTKDFVLAIEYKKQDHVKVIVNILLPPSNTDSPPQVSLTGSRSSVRFDSTSPSSSSQQEQQNSILKSSDGFMMKPSEELSRLDAEMPTPVKTKRLDLVHNAPRYRMFGMPLEVLASKENRPDKVPAIVSSIVKALRSSEGLLSEGLFVKPGKFYEIKDLREQFERSAATTDTSRYTLHSLATILKMFLRELPSPVIPYDCVPYFISALTNAELSKEEYLGTHYSKVIANLPESHKHVLKALLQLFRALVDSPTTDLGPEDTGIIFGPLLAPDKPSQRHQWSGAMTAKALSQMIEKFHEIDWNATPPTANEIALAVASQHASVPPSKQLQRTAPQQKPSAVPTRQPTTTHPIPTTARPSSPKTAQHQGTKR